MNRRDLFGFLFAAPVVAVPNWAKWARRGGTPVGITFNGIADEIRKHVDERDVVLLLKAPS